MALVLLISPGEIAFVDVARQVGIDFVHYNGATSQKYMVETMGSGGGFIDYDGDGDLDIYLVNGAPLPGSEETAEAPANALYRNNGDGSFSDVTLPAGVGDGSFGMGLAAGDIDNDGDIDLYVTNFGANVLYRNNGDGTFSDITAAARVAAGQWSTCAAFADFDQDGFLDLFVCRYVDFSLTNHKFCGDELRDIRAYCHPVVYDPVPNILYRNQGDGTFAEVTELTGVFSPREGKSLGAVWGDYDNDGDPDLYVANDTIRNLLYRNEGDGRFEEVALTAGVGYSQDGQAQAGMGTDFGDYDENGWLDLIVTNFDFEYNALYQGSGEGWFADRSYASGFAEPSINFLGFGAFFFDFDNDGLLDVFVANGHILDNIHLFNDLSTYSQPNFLFRNQGGGRLKEISREAGPDLRAPNAGRGAAPGDFDGDGDEDVLVTTAGQAPKLFRNDGGDRNRWLAVRLVGRRSNRDGVGGRVTVTVAGKRRFKELKAGVSYLSQGALELLFGLGSSDEAEEVEIRWPGGEVEKLGPSKAGSRIIALEGGGRLR